MGTGVFVAEPVSEQAGAETSTEPIIQGFRHRPEVDGLRAVAVIAVVLFHAKFGFPGGYIGVDVFFVISGYLITSLILSDLEQGRFTLGHFWERRARRILPALTLMVITTLIAGWFILLPAEYAALGKSAAWQSFFAANAYFWKAAVNGYFTGAAEEMPLLHTWSLAVEEQFYLVVPLILALLFKFPRLRNRRMLFAVFGGTLLLSLIASAIGVRHFRIAAFYFLPTRAWELLVGSVLALVPGRVSIAQRWIREICAYAGLAAILGPCLLYTARTPFPGLAAVPPCLGTALVIWSNSSNASDQLPTSLGRLLANRGLVFVGLISYSLYLWHWPILAFSRYYLAGQPFTLVYRLAAVWMGLVLATLSWRFIETPFRRRTVCPSRASVFKFAAAALSVSLMLALTIQYLHGAPGRLPKAVQASLAADPKDDLLFVNEMTLEDIRSDKLREFGQLAPGKPTSVLVWGDSHAMAALPAFDELLKRQGLNGKAVTHSSTAPVLNYFKRDAWGLEEKAPQFAEGVVAYVAEKRIPHVVLIGCWRFYPAVMTNASSGVTLSLEDALMATVQKLVSVGAQPWILLQVPSAPFDVSMLLRNRRLSLPELNQRRFCSIPNSYNGVSGYKNAAYIDKLIQAGARIIDPRPAFLDPRHEFYQIVRDDVILFRDDHHLTKRGAEKMLVPVLESSFLPYLTPPTATAERTP